MSWGWWKNKNVTPLRHRPLFLNTLPGFALDESHPLVSCTWSGVTIVAIHDLGAIFRVSLSTTYTPCSNYSQRLGGPGVERVWNDREIEWKMQLLYILTSGDIFQLQSQNKLLVYSIILASLFPIYVINSKKWPKNNLRSKRLQTCSKRIAIWVDSYLNSILGVWNLIQTLPL